MDRTFRKWIAPAIGAAVAVLMMWGILGIGKASIVVPEETDRTIPAAVNEKEIELEEISGGVKKYDAALYLRGSPLKDPFHAERSYASMKGSKKVPEIPALERRKERISSEPVLQGVIEYGENRRAMLAVNGESVTVRKGDRVGIWSVISIGEKTVQLSSKAGNLVLELS